VNVTHRWQRPTVPAPGAVIDGPARYEVLAAATPDSPVETLHVHFDPGSRTRWHTHPRGQTLVVTAGQGWVQSRGRAPRHLTAGDVVSVDAGEEHWHGACATSPMSHLAIQEHDDRGGSTVLEKVTTDHPTTRSRPCS
jgi:quercetin dioxygenase-like cupin family protein